MMEAVGYDEMSVNDKGAHPTNRNLKYRDFVNTMIPTFYVIYPSAKIRH
jgi:hypothetical protein